MGVCNACGRVIEKKAYIIDKYAIGGQTLHKECRNKVYTYVYCKECGDKFVITYGEKESYESKGFPLPKRCKDCRGNLS